MFVYHNATVERPVLKVWNESGTNRGRIGDSRLVRLRSPRHMAAAQLQSTRSSGERSSGNRQFVQNLNAPADRRTFGESRATVLWIMGKRKSKRRMGFLDRKSVV